jgi:hypothetical protein
MGMAALVFTIGSGLLAVAHSQQSWFITRPVASKCPTNPPAAGTYYGVGVKPNSCPTRLRISNGGAGLSGLVGALANEFITYKLRNQSEERFKVSEYLLRLWILQTTFLIRLNGLKEILRSRFITCRRVKRTSELRITKQLSARPWMMEWLLVKCTDSGIIFTSLGRDQSECIL